MSRSPWLALALLPGLWTATARAEGDCMLPPEFRELWPPSSEVLFQPTTLDERQAFRALVPPLLQAARRGGELPALLRARAQAVGFALHEWSHEGERFWALVERRDARRGAGAYVLRVGEAVDVAVQSPHAYFDLGTGTLGARLFLCAPPGLRPRAFLTNTAHRFRGRPGERREDPSHPADVAHNPDHLFQAVTDLLAAGLPDLRVVQLHGFGAKDAERERISAVVSGGTRAPPPWTRKVAVRLEGVLGDGVRLYPDQTELLGATRNAQGRLLQAHPRTRFVHLELSPEVRRAMAAPDRVRALAEALFDPEEGS
jgi:hypothetical protein